MKKICPLCFNTFEDENLEYCPICKLPESLPKSLRVLEDYEQYEARLNKLQDENSIERKRFDKMMAQIQPHYNSSEQSTNLPKCPTCGSTNIRHISSTERGVNAVIFGFFGNKRKCQFECMNPNCRYRW